MKNYFLIALLASYLLGISTCIFLIDLPLNKEQPPKQEVNQTYAQDSLCQVWVDSTHLRVAFKTWYNKNKGKVK